MTMTTCPSLNASLEARSVLHTLKQAPRLSNNLTIGKQPVQIAVTNDMRLFATSLDRCL